MSKKVLILSGSPRKNGNSDLLCDEFMRGVTESGNEAEKIRIAGKKMEVCRFSILETLLPLFHAHGASYHF